MGALEKGLRALLWLAVFGAICTAALMLGGVVAVAWLFLRHVVFA